MKRVREAFRQHMKRHPYLLLNMNREAVMRVVRPQLASVKEYTFSSEEQANRARAILNMYTIRPN